MILVTCVQEKGVQVENGAEKMGLNLMRENHVD